MSDTGYRAGHGDQRILSRDKTYLGRCTIDEVCHRDNLWQAWLDVWGSKTMAQRRQGAGVDGITIAQWALDAPARLEDLREALWAGTYRPRPLLRISIPKRDADESRDLSIPTITDRVAQRAVKNVLEAIWEQRFLPCSHGFRSGRSTTTAVVHVLLYQQRGRIWALRTDIRQCFDNISHGLLLNRLTNTVDKAICDLIVSWLEIGARAPGRGLAQGATISPLLTNIYLHPFDIEMIMRGHALVRFGDDMAVLCTNPAEAQRALGQAAQLLHALALDLNREKTTIVRLSQMRFLGARFLADEP